MIDDRAGSWSDAGPWGRGGLERRGGAGARGRPRRQGKGDGVRRPQKLPWTNGWLRRPSAVGRHFSSTNTCRRKSLHASDTPSGSMGFVGWVAILKMAAMASYSAHGGFWVSISTTVQATLLRTIKNQEINGLICLYVYMFISSVMG